MSDDVNEYGLGAPDTQTGESVEHVHAPDEGSGLAHGLGPSEGPFLGESASEEEGTRFGLGADNTQDGVQVGGDAAEPNPLEHGLESTDVP